MARAASTLFLAPSVGFTKTTKGRHGSPAISSSSSRLPREPRLFRLALDIACYGASAPRLGCLALSKAKGLPLPARAPREVCGCRREDVRLTVKPQRCLDGCPSHGCPSHGQNQRYALNSA